MCRVCRLAYGWLQAKIDWPGDFSLNVIRSIGVSVVERISTSRLRRHDDMDPAYLE